MPTGQGWDVPQDVKGDIEFRWWRVQGNRVLFLLMLCEQPIWYKGHFHKGRMVPCLGEGCRMCKEGVGAQLRFVVTAAEVTSHRAGLLEIGQTVATELRDLALRHGGMPGMVVEIAKYSMSRNSRMELKLIERVEPPWWREIEIPDIKLALYLQWQKQGIEMPDFVKPEKGPDIREALAERFRRPG